MGALATENRPCSTHQQEIRAVFRQIGSGQAWMASRMIFRAWIVQMTRVSAYCWSAG